MEVAMHCECPIPVMREGEEVCLTCGRRGPRAAVTVGRRVRFTRGPLGLIEAPGSRRFLEGSVGAGDEGLYYGPHPDSELAGNDWHLVRVDFEDGFAFAPVHSLQFALA